ncbi:MAG: glycosyltransferase family 4 protein [Gemmatimonadota bacterium]
MTGSEEWILRRICRELHRQGRLNALYFENGGDLPRAEYYFFAHYSRLVQFLERSRRGGMRIVLFPHFEEHGKRTAADVVAAVRQADKVVCLSRSWKDWLVERGLDEDKVGVALGGADPDQFRYREHSDGAIGFVSKYYARKNPDTILEIVRRMPDKRFMLVGRGWAEYPRFRELCALPNFRFVEAEYVAYPTLYGQMDVFVSVSRVEGGPIPLLEAMMSNVVPVASRTGFAPELIQDGENGFLFDVDADVEAIIALVRRAFALRTNVRATVAHLSWKNFVEQLLAFAAGEGWVPGGP